MKLGGSSYIHRRMETTLKTVLFVWERGRKQVKAMNGIYNE